MWRHRVGSIDVRDGRDANKIESCILEGVGGSFMTTNSLKNVAILIFRKLVVISQTPKGLLQGENSREVLVFRGRSEDEVRNEVLGEIV